VGATPACTGPGPNRASKAVGQIGSAVKIPFQGGGSVDGGMVKVANSRSHVTPEEYWRALLTGEHPGLRRGRHALSLLLANPRCKLCHAPFAGPFVLLMGLLGKWPSTKNPRFCRDCLGEAPLAGAEIELSLLFADVRGSTALAERLRPAEFATRMNRFYQAGLDVLIRTDALIDKFTGDEVIGLYVAGFAGPSHARVALQAAQESLQATGYADPDGPRLPIGIGVHTGIAYVGAVGTAGVVSDVTILGDAANVAARLASMARPGEILVSASASTASGLALDNLEHRRLELKGRRVPVDVQVFHGGRPPAT